MIFDNWGVPKIGWGKRFRPFLISKDEGLCHPCEMKVWWLVTLHPQLVLISRCVHPAVISVTVEASLPYHNIWGREAGGHGSCLLGGLYQPISHWSPYRGPPFCCLVLPRGVTLMTTSQPVRENLRFSRNPYIWLELAMLKLNCSRSLAHFLIQLLFPSYLIHKVDLRVPL